MMVENPEMEGQDKGAAPASSKPLACWCPLICLASLWVCRSTSIIVPGRVKAIGGGPIVQSKLRSFPVASQLTLCFDQRLTGVTAGPSSSGHSSASSWAVPSTIERPM